MSPLDLTAAGALVETLYILQGFAGHLAMALLHVRGLLLGNGAEDGLPKVSEQRRNRDGYRQGERGGRQEAERRQLGQSPSERKREGHLVSRQRVSWRRRWWRFAEKSMKLLKVEPASFGRTRFAQFGDNHASPNLE